ncbi:MAG: hypothetical protein AB8B82_16610 [Roseovarius sp.]
MPKYNDQIELSVEDMELIEDALRREKRALSIRALETTKSDMANGEEVGSSMRQIHELLGRLHNQKVFYRPEKGAYVSG